MPRGKSTEFFRRLVECSGGEPSRTANRAEIEVLVFDFKAVNPDREMADAPAGWRRLTAPG